jgi:hypothetical protein
MSATVTPFYLWYLMTGGDTSSILFFISCLWFSVMTFSRFYMGVHSTYDVGGGIVLGWIIYRVMQLYGDYLDWFLVYKEYGYVYIAVIGLILIVAYWIITKPNDHRWSPTFGDTTVVIGVATGGAMAMNLLCHYFIHPDALVDMTAGHALEGLLSADGNYTILERAGVNPATGLRYFPLLLVAKFTVYHSISWIFARIISGFVLLYFCRLVVKYSMYPIITAIIPRPKGIPLDQPASNIYRYEIPVKLATYSTIGFSSVFVCQLLFQYLNI